MYGMTDIQGGQVKGGIGPGGGAARLTELFTQAQKSGAVTDISLNKLLAEKCRRSFKYFLRCAWHIIEPGSPLIHGWHMDVICDHLQACVEGRIQNLIIAIPPRHSKSTIVSVLFPAWLWLREPGKRTLFVSFAARLSDRDSRKCRNLIESVWFQSLFGDKFQLAKDSNTIRRFDNDKGGMRFATSVDGTLTGEGANFVVADDLHNISEIHSEIKREGTNEIWDSTLQSRINPPVEEGHFIIIAQRGHSSDLIGHVKEKDKDLKSYVVLELPAEFDPDNRCRTCLGQDENGEDIIWEDPRQFAGELLWPEGCPQHFLDKQKVNLGSFAYAAQYQQRPVPKEGGIFEWDWFEFYDEHELPDQANWDDCCISVDMNFGTTKQGQVTSNLSWVVASVWARIGARFYLVDMIRGQWKYTQSKAHILALVQKWYMVWAIYVENKANGPAIMDDLMETEGLSGIIPVDPKEFGGDKESRAHSITPICEAHNVYFPAELSTLGRKIMPLVKLEVSTFPLGATNDFVDTFTQAINKMRMRYIAMGVGVGKGEKSVEAQMMGRPSTRVVVPQGVQTEEAWAGEQEKKRLERARIDRIKARMATAEVPAGLTPLEQLRQSSGMVGGGGISATFDRMVAMRSQMNSNGSGFNSFWSGV